MRRNGLTFWFLDNKVAAEGQEEYFMTSTFRFVTFAASSGPSCMANYIAGLLGIGAKKPSTSDEDQVALAPSSPKQTAWLAKRSRFYDGASTSAETSLGVLMARTAIFGISTVLTGSGSIPVTLGPIDNETHVRVLRKCGPSELAYWSFATGVSTLACEAFYNCLFYALLRSNGEPVQIEDGEGGTSSLGLSIISGALISLAASMINGATVYITSNRAVAVLGEDGNKIDDGLMNTVCKVVHDKIFCRILNRDKGVAYIWARCMGFTSNTLTN
eukprot:GILJ01026810.1.p1 GENE.GILJ01026810.1~~GILJ01026810.1.p1  ORF type:complete len:299 (+),score=43.85 GILJ01026810.1:80-898(+)